MQSTTNYGLNIVEGTDIVNPLTQFNPNFTDIDSIMKNNADASIDHATCIKTGTVHAVTRTNTDANVFRFTATGNWNTGDTMTVDGTLVSVYVSDGTTPSNGCFVINSEVLASIQGVRVTLYVNSGDASNISFDDTSVSFTANNVQSAIDALNSAVNIEYSSGVSIYDRLTWKNGGDYDLSNGAGVWTLNDDISNANEILIEYIIATPGQVRYSILMPYAFFTSRGAFPDYSIGTDRVYCSLTQISNNSVQVSSVSNTTGSQVTVRIYYR